MKMLRFSVFLALLSVSVLSACNSHSWIESVKGSGNIASETRSLPAFTSVELRGSVDLVVRQSATQSVRVEADDNILPLISTIVKDGKLIVQTEKNFWTRKSMTIYVEMPEIKGFSSQGSGDIRSESLLKTDELSVTISGSSDVSLEVEANAIRTGISGSGDVSYQGKAARHNISISGSGDIHAANLVTEEYDIAISGSGDCDINASRKIFARISGSGDIIYSGTASDIQSKVSGSGDIRRR